MESEAFTVRFWGTRGSYPVPGRHTVHYGGNTPCVELQIGHHVLIIDAGTGIINLGQDLVRRAQERPGSPIVATLLLTHMHHDHTHGFPFFAPILIPSSIVHILGPHTFEKNLDEVLRTVVLTLNFPVELREMPSLKVIYSLPATETVVLGPEPTDLHLYNVYRDTLPPSPDQVRIRVLKSYAHPSNGVYIYRVEWRNRSVVFASDTEGYQDTDRRLVAFAHDADVLIHDAQYTQQTYTASRQGWGHSTPQMACAVAHLCGARQLVLFHHDPLHDDEKVAQMEREAQQLFPNTIAAYEGLELVL
jgi:phosphoribosyl 1,2-cyclic phosphodiesterase